MRIEDLYLYGIWRIPAVVKKIRLFLKKMTSFFLKRPPSFFKNVLVFFFKCPLSFGLAVGMLADVVSVGVIVINKACV